MKYKFKPQRGIVVAGLLAGAYAQACWYQNTTDCAVSGTHVDTLEFFEGNAIVSATSSWFTYVYSFGSGVPNGYSSHTRTPCAGPAKFVNPEGHTQTLDYWEYGLANGNQGLGSGFQTGKVTGTTCE